MRTAETILSHVIASNGDFPNNTKLPLLIYKKALSVNEAHEVEALFQKNGWKRSWINGIYPFHHYHSNTHEVLGVISGGCKVQFGGEGGQTFEIEKGDVILLPAGVSHKNLGSSADFVCVGAYPFDLEYDMNYGKPGESERTMAAIEKVPLPKTDPVYGEKGPLFQYWVHQKK